MLSTNLVSIRGKWGLSQKEMAHLLDKTRGAYNQYEQRGEMPEETLALLVMLTGIKRHQLLDTELKHEDIGPIPEEAFNRVNDFRGIEGPKVKFDIEEEKDVADYQAKYTKALEEISGLKDKLLAVSSGKSDSSQQQGFQPLVALEEKLLQAIGQIQKSVDDLKTNTDTLLLHFAHSKIRGNANKKDRVEGKEE